MIDVWPALVGVALRRFECGRGALQFALSLEGSCPRELVDALVVHEGGEHDRDVEELVTLELKLIS